MLELKNLKEERFEDILDYFPELEYILEEELALLGGGILRSILKKDETEIADVDLFFCSQASLEETKTYLQSKGYNLVFSYPKGELFTFKKEDTKVQLIAKRFYTSLFDLVSSFDIVACCAAWNGNTMVVHENWYKDNHYKQITFNVIEYPVATVGRIYKYMDKGYYYTPESIKDFIMQVNNGSFDGDHLELYVD